MTNQFKSKPLIALVGFDEPLIEQLQTFDFNGAEIVPFANGLKLVSAWQSNHLNIVSVLIKGEIVGPNGLSLIESIKKQGLSAIPYFLVVRQLNANLRQIALSAGVADVLILPLRRQNVEKRVNFLIQNWKRLAQTGQVQLAPIRSISLGKRIFDVVFAGLALVALLPLFLIVYVLIKLESKGPAFYYSLRVGTGYKVFRFYKFRSMFVNADQKVKDLMHLNQYALATGDGANVKIEEPSSLCQDCQIYGKCQFTLFADKEEWCEKDLKKSKIAKAGSAFFKIKNDPRITRIGNFIRNTSIDELPQLWNVIIGDMSIVGNRPLPLYEAEKLTTDKYILRFAAPAGITGLWQVEKRGKGEMSEDERLMLDNVYAQNHSLKSDIKLILKTIPALLQKESV